MSKVLNLIENMSLLELKDLINSLEKKYNFQKLSENSNFENENENTKEKNNKKYSLYLADSGKNKISIIKFIKDYNNLGLKDAKNIVDSCPSLIKKDLDENSIKILKEKIETLGGKCDVKENV